MEYPAHDRRVTLGRLPGPRLRWWLAGLSLLATGLFAVTWIVTPTTRDVLIRVARVDSTHHTSPLSPSEVPRYLADAVVAMEDQNFYTDHGVNLEGLLRAAGFDLIHLCECQGGSTITEQLAEDIYLNGSDRSIWGRWWDIVLALKIEGHLTKTQVLDSYLSQVSLGDGAVGVTQASVTYFHRPLAQDSLAQLALLAGLPQGPALLDPVTHPQAARVRRKEVLEQMAIDGYISKAQAQNAERQPLR
ncbi:MAG TPA: transglycosylase domain-containing protein [Candidatus Dormibacteraeota bacterium]|nr:transglycosylase domain-containing protein [Candidatus Dormibacteraeota bacterium]